MDPKTPRAPSERHVPAATAVRLLLQHPTHRRWPRIRWATCPLKTKGGPAGQGSEDPLGGLFLAGVVVFWMGHKIQRWTSHSLLTSASDDCQRMYVPFSFRQRVCYSGVSRQKFATIAFHLRVPDFQPPASPSMTPDISGFTPKSFLSTFPFAHDPNLRIR